MHAYGPSPHTSHTATHTPHNPPHTRHARILTRYYAQYSSGPARMPAILSQILPPAEIPCALTADRIGAMPRPSGSGWLRTRSRRARCWRKPRPRHPLTSPRALSSAPRGPTLLYPLGGYIVPGWSRFHAPSSQNRRANRARVTNPITPSPTPRRASRPKYHAKSKPHPPIHLSKSAHLAHKHTIITSAPAPSAAAADIRRRS
ncbi:hypothetical protein HYPSUDRAFT_202989 [Hypholoma sublateritium FD-334 SS-4]|uniref:Uncharacterized protein n=1 Tax=Hypholoma sublateritium (strain FD-334 SS-4) TaxID=945553 RepID=A0A0D2NY65_HYPSF|nr:hypothetical protein HYPSUDRAFT_202989 [Hypholoma sublateritium FD-334 SS-4]